VQDSFHLSGLIPPKISLRQFPENLFGISTDRSSAKHLDNPLVTVITTAFNCEATVADAITSVLHQTCGNVQYIIVDDCSTDGTRAILQSMAAADSRIRLILNAENVGTYASKNRAIMAAEGDFITLHDSDDWMHPQRIEQHLVAMRNQSVAASLSDWFRMDASGQAVLRKGGGGYLHRNPASTFIRSEALQRVGFFDSVRVGADSEMLSRIRCSFGKESIASIDLCLGIGLHHDQSLTRSGETAFDDFRYSAVRLEYAESWGAWHMEMTASGRTPFLNFPLVERPFSSPTAITVHHMDGFTRTRAAV
jgi:glycosyltransferase involved in cell wall biosynthesis